jgi:Flp pilus assembly protein TadD
LLGLCASLCGCRTLSNRGPVSQSVATCRQLTQQGVNAMERGDWKRAESLLSRAVQASAGDADARRNYAETLWHRGAPQEALVQLKEARRLAAEDPALAVRAGEVYLALGQNDSANQMVDEALRMDPKFAPAWALRGHVANATGQTRAALAYYQRAMGYAPDDRSLGILVAEAYRLLNEPDRALAALQSVADRYSPGEEPQQVLLLQGLALTAVGRYDDAARSLTQAARRDSPTPEILCRLAEAEFLAGRFASAQSTLRQSLALDPDHASSRALAARIAVAPSSDRTIVR